MLLTPKDTIQVLELIEELDAVVDADDGTLFPYPLVVKLDRIKEIFHQEEIETEQ